MPIRDSIAALFSTCRPMYRVISTFAAVILFICCAPLEASAKKDTIYRSNHHAFALEEIAGGIRNPWSIAFLPTGDALITARGGELYRLDQTGELHAIGNPPEVFNRGQGGLLDVTSHPQFEETRLIFMSHSVSVNGSHGTAISRAELQENDTLSNLRTIFLINRFSVANYHFGSRLLFLDDGSLLVTVGDRGERDRAQNLDDHAGSVLRIDIDGKPLSDNPFFNGGGAAEVYTYGHRNPQGIALRPGTDEVWISEHGPRGGDEINLVETGLNYGWPVITYGKEYFGNRPIGIGFEQAGMEQPKIYWTPSIAPSGISFYDGTLFPEWRGDLFVAALAGKQLRRLALSGQKIVEQEILLENEAGRIRDVVQDKEGYLWIITDERRGVIYRLEPINL